MVRDGKWILKDMGLWGVELMRGCCLALDGGDVEGFGSNTWFWRLGF